MDNALQDGLPKRMRFYDARLFAKITFHKYAVNVFRIEVDSGFHFCLHDNCSGPDDAIFLMVVQKMLNDAKVASCSFWISSL